MRTLTIADPTLIGARRSFTDTFTRTNNGSTLGSPWTAHSGTWGITSNTAYLVSGADNTIQMASVDIGSSDMVVEWTLSTNQNQNGYNKPVYFPVRVVDQNNCLFLCGISSNTTTLNLYRLTSGVTTLIAGVSSSGWQNTGNVIRVEVVGSTVTVSINGVQVMSQSGITEHQNATRAGIGGYLYTAGNSLLTSRRWSFFKVSAA